MHPLTALNKRFKKAGARTFSSSERDALCEQIPEAILARILHSLETTFTSKGDSATVSLLFGVIVDAPKKQDKALALAMLTGIRR